MTLNPFVALKGAKIALSHSMQSTARLAGVYADRDQEQEKAHEDLEKLLKKLAAAVSSGNGDDVEKSITIVLDRFHDLLLVDEAKEELLFALTNREVGDIRGETDFAVAFLKEIKDLREDPAIKPLLEELTGNLRRIYGELTTQASQSMRIYRGLRRDKERIGQQFSANLAQLGTSEHQIASQLSQALRTETTSVDKYKHCVNELLELARKSDPEERKKGVLTKLKELNDIVRAEKNWMILAITLTGKLQKIAVTEHETDRDYVARIHAEFVNLAKLGFSPKILQEAEERLAAEYRKDRADGRHEYGLSKDLRKDARHVKVDAA
ncbi:MAG: hypothetical protein H6502_04740 [Candidatus Woesearchaeota archaeon]|nr:MAG: hypothetical protein H6502_04740 [Candidatus Woesearchaeota archaeon]